MEEQKLKGLIEKAINKGWVLYGEFNTDVATESVLKLLKQQIHIARVSGSFYSLIDRLQAHSEWKYPNRKWNNDAYYGIAFQWMGKEKELEQKVLKLEEEMK